MQINKDIHGENVAISGTGDVIGVGERATGVKIGDKPEAAEAVSPPSKGIMLALTVVSLLAALVILALGVAGKIPWKYAGPIAGALVGAPIVDGARRRSN